MKQFYNLEALFYEFLTRSLILMSNSVYIVFSLFGFCYACVSSVPGAPVALQVNRSPAKLGK